MLKIPDAERAYLNEMRSLGTDTAGRETLVGLTVEESIAYFDYAKARIFGKVDGLIDGKRYLELHGKHERVRLAVLVAEIDARNDKSARH